MQLKMPILCGVAGESSYADCALLVRRLYRWAACGIGIFYQRYATGVSTPCQPVGICRQLHRADSVATGVVAS